MPLLEQFPCLRSRWIGYAFAGLSVAVVAASLSFATYVLRSPYLIPFTMAVACSTLFGLGPGLAALFLATVVSGCFFAPRLGSLTLNPATWMAIGSYSLALLLTRLAEHYLRRRVAQSFLSRNLAGKQDGEVATRQALLGRLDGDAEGELYGWALDKSCVSIPPKITFYVDERPVGEVFAVHYRPDVEQHSFFFDLSECCTPKSAARVDAKFSDRTPLANSPLKLKIPARAVPLHSQTILFMHIPKTAGTAFREPMMENYKHSQVAYLYPHPPGLLVSNLGLLPLEQRARFRMIMGHFQYGIHEFLPQEYTYVTIVRDPVERVISHYHYLRHTQPETISDGTVMLSLIETLERGRTVNLDNLMVRCFSGVDANDVPPGHIDQRIYDLAIHHLRTQFKFVGYQDRVDEAYAALRRHFNWKPRTSLEIVNKGERPGGNVDDGTRAAIECFNTWDCRLYSQIRELFP
jgi:Sulfotransferase family